MNARRRGTGCVIGGIAGLVAACGGTERGSAPADADARGPRVETRDRAAMPEDGLELGGGQTSDFGDGVNSPCEYAIDTVSREAALAEGWPVDADLARLQPLVSVQLQRESAACELEPAGMLRIESHLVGIHVARGTPVPELAGRVECEPMLSYGIDVTLDAGDGWISGLFHAEFTSDGTDLYGSAFEPAESVRGELALSVDRGRPHLARANLALEFTRSVVRGELSLVAYYSDQREPLMTMSERLLWPSSAEAGCADARPPEDGSERLSLDDYRAGRL